MPQCCCLLTHRVEQEPFGHTPLLTVVQMWRGAPEQLVGWFARHVCRKRNGNFQYMIPNVVRDMPHYSIVLTKAAVMASKYLAAYTDELPAEIHAFVAEHRNCEDIAMQFLISSKTGLPPWHLSNEPLTFRCAHW